MITIIGGGIAGVCIALKLSKYGRKITIYEEKELLSTPYSHLHLGGSLYPEISLDEAIELYNESFLFLKEFPQFIKMTKTKLFLSNLTSDEKKHLLFRCNMLDMMHQNDFGTPYFEKIDDNTLIVSEYIIMEKELKQELKDRLYDEILANRIIVMYEKFVPNDGQHGPIMGPTMGPILIRTGCSVANPVEHKGHWIFRYESPIDLPYELAYLGKRNTPNALLQITPIDDYSVVIHKMNSECSIVDDIHPLASDKQRTDRLIEFMRDNVPAILSEVRPEAIIFNHYDQQVRRDGKRTSKINVMQNGNEIIIDVILIKACGVVQVTNSIIDIISQKIKNNVV